MLSKGLETLKAQPIYRSSAQGIIKRSATIHPTERAIFLLEIDAKAQRFTDKDKRVPPLLINKIKASIRAAKSEIRSKR
jgi:hypothetical protein